MVPNNREEETAVNRILRRADWRFLLPDPRPARSICFNDGLLAQAVAEISDSVIEPTARSAGSCDLAVAINPTQQTLQAALTALQPGGACYIEWTSPFAGGPTRLQQRLESIGFIEVRCYWPWPPPDRATTLYWLPIESPHIIQYFLANRKPGRGLLSRTWSKFLETVWRMSSNLQWLAPLSFIARKPPAAKASVPDTIRANWNTWNSSPPPQRLDWMLLTGGAKPINKVIGLVFSESNRSPSIIVKLARVDEAAKALDREATCLRAVQALRPELDGVPQVLFSQKWAGQSVLGETALTGQPLYTMLRRDTGRDLALKVTTWLSKLAGRPPLSARSDWWDRLIETTIGEFERNFGHVIDLEKLQATRTALAKLGDLPLVYEQRDCSPWNILIGPNGEPLVLDWESAEPRGLPALDLIYFLTYLSFFLDGAMDSQRFRESYRAALDPLTFTGRITAECQQRYLARVGLDPNVLRPLRLLTWLIHSQSEYRQLAAEGTGLSNPASLRGSLFVSLWEEELSYASTNR